MNIAPAFSRDGIVVVAKILAKGAFGPDGIVAIPKSRPKAGAMFIDSAVLDRDVHPTAIIMEVEA